MAKCEFSETQFVMGFFSEYINRIRSLGIYASMPFVFPTTVMEPIFASDLIVDNLTSIDFFQFKRSDYINYRRGRAEIRAGLPKAFRPYYRFKVYNQGVYPQFDRLRLIANVNPNFEVYYCAPKFHTHKEFQQLFWTQGIIKNSAIIDCNQFNSSTFYPPSFNVNDGDDHFIVYNKSKIGYMCSKKKEIRITDLNEEVSRYSIVGEEVPQQNGLKLVNQLFDILLNEKFNSSNLNEFRDADPSIKLKACTDELLLKYETISLPRFKINE